jgi:hypothetical protein
MAKKLLLVVLAAGVLTLLLSGVALAATPQDVYDDYVAHGSLTSSYTKAELKAYLNDSTVHQYGDQTIIKRLDSEVESILSRGSFPFTGFELVLAAIVAVVLVGGGILLKRVSRQS